MQKTVVFVTHDIEEAVKMGDRIAILDVGGVLEQYDTPAEILGRPASDMVADFVGRRPRAQAAAGHRPSMPSASSTRRRVAPDATLADARAAIAKWDAGWVAVVDDDGVLRGYVDDGARRRRRHGRRRACSGSRPGCRSTRTCRTRSPRCC